MIKRRLLRIEVQRTECRFLYKSRLNQDIAHYIEEYRGCKAIFRDLIDRRLGNASPWQRFACFVQMFLEVLVRPCSSLSEKPIVLKLVSLFIENSKIDYYLSILRYRHQKMYTFHDPTLSPGKSFNITFIHLIHPDLWRVLKLHCTHKLIY